MEKLKQFLLILLLSVALFSCKKDLPISTDNLVGYACLYSNDGLRQTDNSGITVSIAGASKSTTTGTDGKWTFSNLELGTYTIVITKQGYSTMQYPGTQFFGYGQSFGSTSLYPLPSYTVINLADTSYQDDELETWETFTGNVPSLCHLRLFFGYNSNVSSNPANYFYTMAWNLNGIIPNVPQETVFLSYFFSNYGINAGETLYMVAYSENLITDSNGYSTSVSYYDSNTGRNFYPCLSPMPSNVVKVIVQ